ncbi:MAG: hypothetical protein RLY86_2495 [Pseudomonadota bacterium]|jgi:TRAP transporter TAXI family solute receptor
MAMVVISRPVHRALLTILAGAFLAALAVLATQAAQAAQGAAGRTPNAAGVDGPTRSVTTLIIGTGRVTGTYFPTGGALCRILNRGTVEHGLRCVVEPTDGSIANLTAIRDGGMALAMAQSDLVQAAVAATGPFEGASPAGGLRSLLSLQTEMVTVLVRGDVPVTRFGELKGRIVSLGPDGSALRKGAQRVVEAHGLTEKDFRRVEGLAPDQQVEALCDGQVDAAIFIVAHPNGAVREAMQSCAAVPLALDPGAMEIMTPAGGALIRALVPAAAYPGMPADVLTVGVAAVLVAPDTLAEGEAYQFTRAVLAGLDELRAEHPVLATLDPRRMVTEGLVAPQHPGALRAAREAALVP